MIEIFSELWATARRNKLRTALTGFAVAWGIFMLICLLGAGNGLINATQQNSNRFLANSMQISGGATSLPYDGLKEGRVIQLNDADTKRTQENFTKNIETVGTQIAQYNVTISRGENYMIATLMGVSPNAAAINKKEILQGRFINENDIRESRKNIVISEEQAKELLPQNPNNILGENIKIDAFAYRVVGIYKNDNSQQNDIAYCAFTTVRTIYKRGDKTDNIIFSFQGLETEAQNQDFEKEYRTQLNASHRIAPDDEQAVWIWNRFTQNMQMQTGLGILNTALWVIGIFTLLSGIVGVSNIMLITVKERTREFGIRKAIGASPMSILRLIIIESIVVTTFFGYIGMVAGMAANWYMDATIGQTKVDTGLFQASMFVNPTVGFNVCIQATILMIVAGTIAGLIPARKAARIRPIEALKAE